MEHSCIVIAEDEKMVQRALTRIVTRALRDLGREDVSVLVADSAEEALELVRDHDEARERRVEYMVLTDGEMKGDMKGPELIESIERLVEERLVIRILQSGNEELKAEAERVHATFYGKPDLDASEIERMVRLFMEIEP